MDEHINHDPEDRYVALRTQNTTNTSGTLFLGIDQWPGPRWLMTARRMIVAMLTSIKGTNLGTINLETILTQIFSPSA
jgi:hypothetical protein